MEVSEGCGTHGLGGIRIKEKKMNLCSTNGFIRENGTRKETFRKIQRSFRRNIERGYTQETKEF